jgi:hypothetical protein
MSKSLTIFVFCAMLFVLSPQDGRAEQPINCIAEPTDMIVQYGNLLKGPNCVIASAGDTDVFRFAGAAGEKVVLQVTDLNGLGALVTCITLFDSNGQPTPQGTRRCSDDTARIEETLAISGQHTILVEGYTGMLFALAVERVLPSGAPSVPLCFGCTINEPLEVPGDLDSYFFNAAPGDVITVQATDLSGLGSQGPCITLFGPNGQPTSHGATVCAETIGRIDETITQAGLHTVLVEIFQGFAAMPYTVSLQCVAGNCPTIVLPVCDIQMSKASYVNGEPVMAQVLRIANPGTAPVFVEIGVWSEVPGATPSPYGNFGVSRDLPLPPGYNHNFGPRTLFTVAPSSPRGTYWFNCRLKTTAGRRQERLHSAVNRRNDSPQTVDPSFRNRGRSRRHKLDSACGKSPLHRRSSQP